MIKIKIKPAFDAVFTPQVMSDFVCFGYNHPFLTHSRYSCYGDKMIVRLNETQRPDRVAGILGLKPALLSS